MIKRKKMGQNEKNERQAIAFDPYTHGYYKVGGRVGGALNTGG